jgi:hypothetical protein
MLKVCFLDPPSLFDINDKGQTHAIQLSSRDRILVSTLPFLDWPSCSDGSTTPQQLNNSLPSSLCAKFPALHPLWRH